ncbi:MAG: DUF1207 domain-containing protein [bacterium]
MKYLLLLITTFLFTLQILPAQNKLLFTPLSANVFEPRVGAMYQFDDEKLRLDIGTSVDLLEIYKNDNSEIRFGTDFFTFTRLRSEGRLKFPVETSDYFFGVNFSNKFKYNGLDMSSRLRVAHISSHLVDGLSDEGKFDKMPFVYSREFIDFVLAADIKGFRPYAGVNFVFSTQPKDVNTLIPQFGLEFPVKTLKTATKDFLELKLSYDFKLGGNEHKYLPIHSVQVSCLFLTWEKMGVSLNVNGYTGPSMHGMFYRDIDRYISTGFQIIFY